VLKTLIAWRIQYINIKEEREKKKKSENMKYSENTSVKIKTSRNLRSTSTASKSPKQASKLVGKNFVGEGQEIVTDTLEEVPQCDGINEHRNRSTPIHPQHYISN